MTTIVAGTRDGLCLLDGQDEVRELAGREITALYKVGGAILAIADERELVRIDAGGVTSLAVSREHRLLCLAVADGETFVGTASAHLLRLENGELHQIDPFEKAPTRDRWHTPWGGPPDVRSMSEAADRTLYVNVHVGGIVHTRDRGETWQPTIDVDSDVHQVLADPSDPARIVAACAWGLAESRDHGATWAIASEGMHAAYCRAVALTHRDVLVTCSDGPRGSHAALYRRPRDASRDVPFERCRKGLPEWFDGNIDTASLDAVDEEAAFGTSSGEVYASTDGGENWERVGAAVPAVNCLLIKPIR